MSRSSNSRTLFRLGGLFHDLGSGPFRFHDDFVPDFDFVISGQYISRSRSGVEARALFGAKVSPVPEEIQQKWKLDDSVGALIGAVYPDSTAEAAGFQAGDVLLSLDGAKIMGAGDAVQKIAARKAGVVVTIEFRRGETLSKKAITLKARPFEKSDAYEVLYGTVPSRGGRLRTILTRPREEGKHPAFFFIQGIGLGSIDNPVGPLGTHKILVDDFARAVS